MARAVAESPLTALPASKGPNPSLRPSPNPRTMDSVAAPQQVGQAQVRAGKIYKQQFAVKNQCAMGGPFDKKLSPAANSYPTVFDAGALGSLAEQCRSM